MSQEVGDGARHKPLALAWPMMTGSTHALSNPLCIVYACLSSDCLSGVTHTTGNMAMGPLLD